VGRESVGESTTTLQFQIGKEVEASGEVDRRYLLGVEGKSYWGRALLIRISSDVALPTISNSKKNKAPFHLETKKVFLKTSEYIPKLRLKTVQDNLSIVKKIKRKIRLDSRRKSNKGFPVPVG
jgi:hypothetical protein